MLGNERFHQTLNNIHPTVEFTGEIESDSILNYLDAFVQRTTDGSLLATVYRKLCDTGNFLDFNSHHPAERKRSVVRSWLHRSTRIPSTRMRTNEQAIVNEQLAKRDYPSAFIQDIQKRIMTQKGSEKEKETTR